MSQKDLGLKMEKLRTDNIWKKVVSFDRRVAAFFSFKASG